MKKLVMALVAFVGLAFAGGNISPVAQVDAESPLAGLYIGGGVGSMWTYRQGDFDFTTDTEDSIVDATLGLRVGYEFYNDGQFTGAVEGRVLGTVNADDLDTTIYSIYVKPGYIFGDTGFSAYGLAGWSFTRWNIGNIDTRTDGFSFGAGVEYTITKHLSVSMDWTSNVWNETIEGTKDINNDAVTVWVNYKF